jgi:signal transduction histidine kinase
MLQQNRKLPSRTAMKSSVLLAAAVVIAAAIFVVDTVTDLEIAASALYGSVVLIAVRLFDKRVVLLVCVGCIALTILSALLSLGEVFRSVGIINCLIGIVVIVATTYLGLKNQAAGVALQEARAELAHVNRVTTLGELTASIAHEVNQPITGAVTNADAALSWLNHDPPNLQEARRALEAIAEDGQRASAIITRIRALVTKVQRTEERLEVNEIIQDALGLTQREVHRNRITLHTQLANNLPPISGDRIQLQQVVLNLILNAIDAMNGPTKRPLDLLISTEREDARGVVVTVRDTGPGLDPGSIHRLFDPFFTTKTSGMGMGLSICRSTIEAHGGRVWAEENPGPGATFRFRLPTSRVVS